MTDTNRMENVKVRLEASISIDGWPPVHLIRIERNETGRFTLSEAQEVLQNMATLVTERCKTRIGQRMLQDQRRLEISGDSHDS